MKKLLFGLIATVMLSVTGNAQNVAGLSNDINFKNYIKNEAAFLEKATDTNLAQQILSDSKVDENEMPKFYNLFSTNENNYLIFLRSQVTLLNLLEERYSLSRIPKAELAVVIEKEIENINFEITKLSPDCRKTYQLEMAAAYATAVVEHLGCVALDLTVIAGVICHGGVSVIHYAATQEALDNFKECAKR